MTLELVRAFDPTAGEYPKGIDFDRRGNIYVSMQLLGQVRRIAPDGTEETIAHIGDPGDGMLNGLAVIENGRPGATVVYASFVHFTDSSLSGVYRINGDGSVDRVPGSEGCAANGMTVDRQGNIYISETFTGSIWRIGHDSGAAEVWIQHPLLEGDGSLDFGVPLGVADLAVHQRALYATVEEKSRLVRIEINKDGMPGEPTVIVEAPPTLYMIEGVALAPNGTAFLSSWLNSTLYRLEDDGSLVQLAGASDGLLGPVTLAFGEGRLSKYLYVVNQSAFIFEGPESRPALYRMKILP